jgi:beta-glucosidase
MRRPWRWLLCLAVCVLGLAAGPPAARAAGDPVDCATAPWMDRSKSPQERASLVLAQMTLDEKIQEMGSLRDATHSRETPPIPRLCIPALRLNNGSAGVSTGGPVQFPATALPAPIGLAATWDPRQATRYGVVEGRETVDQGRNLLEGPDINIARVPVNGRTFEAYGEDPFLAARITVGDIRGIQSQGVIANAKHYAANNQETDRSTINELIDERTLHEIYLPAFEAAVKDARTGSVMCAKNQVNGEFSCQNRELLTDILKGSWRFPGFVVSDFNSCHNTVKCANNGMEFELPVANFFSNSALKAALAAGTVTMATIDEHVHRILATMIRFGIFDRPQTTSPIDAAAGGAVSRDIAEQAAVLLKNDPAAAGGTATLPLNPQALHSIAVLGPFAGAAMTGGGGSSHVLPLYTVNPVDGIRNRVGPGVTVTYDDGSDVARAAGVAVAADVAVVMVGDNESEGRDRPNLSLAGNQDQLVAAIAAANPRTVVVLKSGAPVLMPWISSVPAILETWYPGEEDGNVVAALLFGDVNPSGRLPITFPRRDSDVPANTPAQYPGVNGVAMYSEGVFVGYRHYDAHGIEPLFPFGYGLSYTSFRLDHLRLSPGGDVSKGEVTVHVNVTNTGSRTGSQVVQVYVGHPANSAVPEPPHQLAAFTKVTLRPGQTRQVALHLDPRAFAYWDAAGGRWVVQDGTYQIFAGSSSRDLPLSAPVRITDR